MLDIADISRRLREPCQLRIAEVHPSRGNSSRVMSQAPSRNVSGFLPAWNPTPSNRPRLSLFAFRGFESAHVGLLRRRISSHPVPSSSMNLEGLQRVLVLGGTGRVGTETIRALLRISSYPLSVTVAGRDDARGQKICRQLRAGSKQRSTPVTFAFSKVDINDDSILNEAVQAHDIVIHTAGPFQRKNEPDRVLRASMAAKVPYMDICDALDHSVVCKKLHDSASERGYRALISTGIYPGLSNLMASEAVRLLDGEHVDSLKLYYHTAGSGGIGATVLASTFLLLSEDAVAYDSQGQKVCHPSAGKPEVVDFKGAIGKRTTYMLNLPEVVSLHQFLLHGSKTELFAKFSTGPPVWNWLLQAMAKWTPRELLANREAMFAFSQFSMPFVRAVDLLSGARTGILAVADGPTSSVILAYEHESLARCVGEATAAFAVELLETTQEDRPSLITPGVHFPEELPLEVRKRVFENATLTANFFTTTTASNAT